MDLQIDNYSESAIYPVLLHSTKKEVHSSVDMGDDDEHEEHGEDDDEDDAPPLVRRGTSSAAAGGGPTDPGAAPVDPMEVPLLQITLIEELPREGASTTSILKYVAVRMLPLAVEVESATLQLLYADLLADLKFVDSEQVNASATPTAWAEGFNKTAMSPRDQSQLVDVYHSQVAAQASKMYIEKLILHPMKLTLTFVQTPFPRQRGKESFQATAINILTSLAGVDRMQIRLKSFEVEDAMESRASLMALIKNKTLHDLQAQLAQLAGSLTVIGSPMGFARKVGTGVKSFFYEPYQGAVHSPHDFVVGLGRGTSNLFQNVVSGAMNSTVALVGTASKGIGFLSGDQDYVRKRALKRQRQRTHGGIMDGLIDGSESVLSGIASGMSGLVTKPFEEARKSGVQGFFRGVGLGLIGAAVKPVMGLTDGLASLASGISKSVGEASVYVQVRPARALERSATEVTDLVIVPLNLEAAFAQEFVLRRAKLNGYEDAFLNYVPMDSAGEAIILSDTYVYWRRPKALWGRTWANISHIFFMYDSIGIMLYGGDSGAAVVVPCGTRPCALRVYGALSSNAHRMGYPAKVVPVDLVAQSESFVSPAARESFMLKQAQAASTAGALDGYRFGSANSLKLKKITGPEADVLRRGEALLQLKHGSWQELDERVWRFVWEWDCTHAGLQAARCSATVIVNKSPSPIQIARVQIVHGRNVLLIGSDATGYETESRAIMPGGSAVVFLWAFSPSPIEIGHLQANINTAAFSVTIASTQRESCCESRGGFTVGFLEKSVSEWWSKYVLLVT